MSTSILWFRQDLRLDDNPALLAAVSASDALVPLFIDDPLERSVSQLGQASRVWLHHSLARLQQALEQRGSTLFFAQGEALSVLQQAAARFGADSLYWNRCYDPVTRDRDAAIKVELAHLNPRSFNASLLFEPWDALKDDGTPYRVFTPFWNRLSERLIERAAPLPNAPSRLPLPPGVQTDKPERPNGLNALNLLPAQHWHEALIEAWTPGEAGAQSALGTFMDSAVRHYDTGRNLPAEEGTSCLSPHLHFGEIGPRQVIARLLGPLRSLQRLPLAETTFAKEIIWREFGYSQLFHFPHTPDQPLDQRFKQFAWRTGKQADQDLLAWQQGRTGVPIVDAGMRQLYATGWMHNRVRMVVASYLVKNLLIPWQAGERWFRDTLVDADLASNTLGWQWAAGSGADAAPFFRIFNPVLQGEKFDRDGSYVKRWVPELNALAKRHIHQPWTLPAAERSALSYPPPLVDLKASRLRALAAFQALKTTEA